MQRPRRAGNRHTAMLMMLTIMVGLQPGLLSCSTDDNDRPSGAESSIDEAGTGSRAPLEGATWSVTEAYPGYGVVSSMDGSYSVADAREKIILLSDPTQSFDGNRHHSTHRAIWIPEDATDDRHATVRLRTLGYTTDELDMLTPFIESIGSAHPVFGFADVTGDGRDNLVFLRTHGLGTTLYILSVDSGEFAYLMAGPINMNTILSMQLLSGPGELPIEFRLEGILYNAETESPWRWAEYAWDEEAGEFVVSGSGILESEPGT